jgi:hypothetical protein
MPFRRDGYRAKFRMPHDALALFWRAGVVSRFAIDFVATRATAHRIGISAIEINRASAARDAPVFALPFDRGLSIRRAASFTRPAVFASSTADG